MAVDQQADTAGDYARLNAEAKRLLDFKRENVKWRNRTACPECATSVDVRAKKCPQCSSDISAHTEEVRRQLEDLDRVTAQLRVLHEQYMEHREAEASMQPFWERIRGAFSDPRTATDLKTVVPAFLLFFAFVATLRLIGNAVLFWSGSIAGGIIAYSLLKRSALRRFITVEIYRTALILGLIVALGGTVAIPQPAWLHSSDRVEVTATAANIRQEASASSAIVATVAQGEELAVLDKKGPWYRVKTKDEETGWVHTSVVKN